MNFRSLLIYAWIMVFLIAPTKGAVISGIVFDDADASGEQDDPNNEPGIPSVSVIIIDINKVRQTVTTDQNGFYQADVPPGRVKVDVDDSTLPPGYLQTAGMDPSRHSVPVSSPRLDGYCWPNTSPTQCCANKKKKVRISHFLNHIGDQMIGKATIDHPTSMWEGNLFNLPSDGVRYDVDTPGAGWLRDKMETSITVGFNGSIGSQPPFLFNTPDIPAKDWHIKKCGSYRVRIFMNYATGETKTKIDGKCTARVGSYYKATSYVCWEMVVST
jgi:hypothetical protein